MLLPKSPNEEEKYLYTNNFSKVFCTFGFLALICQVVSMASFASKSPWLYWFYVYILLYFIYMGFTYFTGIMSKEFDYNSHSKLRQDLVQAQNYPSIDIFLPSAGEDLEVIANTFKYCSRLEWKGDLKFYALDDSGREEVRVFAERYGFRYIARPNRGEWKKAGNIRNGFAQSDGKYIVIFDADFCPRTDFLLDTVPYFEKEDKIAIIQTPQFFSSYQGQNVIERGFNYKQELFYRVIQPGRGVFGGSVCCGTNAIYRRTALEPFGGTALMGHSEDMHTGFNCVSTGWSIKYLPLVLAKGNTPEDLASYFTQQYRWALGNLILISSKKFWLSRVPNILKMNYVASILYYAVTGAGTIVIMIPCLFIVLFIPGSVSWTDTALLIPGFLMAHLVQPLWSRAKWTLSAVGVSRFVGWSALAAMVDIVRGKEMGWVTTGDKKTANKLVQFLIYKHIFVFWNIFCLVVVAVGALYWIVVGNLSVREDLNWIPVVFFTTVYTVTNLKVLSTKDLIAEGKPIVHWCEDKLQLRSSQFNYSSRLVFVFAILFFIFSAAMYFSPNFTNSEPIGSFNSRPDLSFSEAP